MPSQGRSAKGRSRSRIGARLRRVLFDLLTDRRLVAAVWLLAAALCVLLVVVGGGEQIFSVMTLEKTGSDPATARGLAAALAFAVTGLGAMWWRRLRAEVSPELELDGDVEPGPSPWWGRVALSLLVLGSILMVGNWLLSHRYLPAGELVLPLNEEVETLEVVQGDRHVQIMLPLRMTFTGGDFDNGPTASIRFALPGSDGVEPRNFTAGQSLDVEGLRFSLSGFSSDQSRLEATFVDAGGDGVVAGVGHSFRLPEGGPSHRVSSLTENYLGVFLPGDRVSEANVQMLVRSRGYPLDVLGPAARLTDERGRDFWVFQRDAGVEKGPIRLEEIRHVPAAVMTVSEVRPLWPFVVGLIFFVVGFLGWLIFPEVIIRRRDERLELLSINRVDRWQRRGDRPHRWRFALYALAGGGLIASFWAGASVATLLLSSALMACLVLATSSSQKPASLFAAAAVPVGVVVGAVVAFGSPSLEAGPSAEVALWAAILAGWLAMSMALLLGGLDGEPGDGHRGVPMGLTVGVAIWAVAGSVMASLMEMGSSVGQSVGLPLVADGRPVAWRIPDFLATAELELVALQSSGALTVALLALPLLASLAMAGRLFGSLRVALVGWLGAFAAAVVSLVQMTGLRAERLHLPDEAPYEEAARQWLQRRDLPANLIEAGGFDGAGVIGVDTASLGAEILFLSVAAVLALAMAVAVTADWLPTRAGDNAAENSPQLWSGRDDFAAAVIFGMASWALGLLLAVDRFGAAGILAFPEWLGLGVVCAVLGLLVLGWRRGPSALEGLAGHYGPALGLGLMVWAMAIVL